MAKKRFEIDKATNEALSQTMQMAKHHDSHFINADILLSKIEVDPENPRKHSIKVKDLRSGPKKSDKDYKTKQEEYLGLCELSASIKKDGLIHPIVVFKNNENYKLVAGERRLFASIIANKTQIEARVFKNKPKALDMKIIQWMENDSRKNLSLYKKLVNIKSIMKQYYLENNEKLTAIALSRLLCISRQQCQYYLSIISNSILMEVIQNKKIAQFRVARELTSLSSEAEILKALETIQQKKNRPLKRKIAKDKSKNVGRKRTKVSLGNTANISIVREIVDSILSLEKYNKYLIEFNNTDWSCFNESTKAFQKLLKFLEKEMKTTV